MNPKVAPFKVTTARQVFGVVGIGSVVVNDAVVYHAETAFDALLIFMRAKTEYYDHYRLSKNFALMIEPLKEGEIVVGYNDKKQITVAAK